MLTATALLISEALGCLKLVESIAKIVMALSAKRDHQQNLTTKAMYLNIINLQKSFDLRRQKMGKKQSSKRSIYFL